MRSAHAVVTASMIYILMLGIVGLGWLSTIRSKIQSLSGSA